MFLLKKWGFDPTELATYPDDVFIELGSPMSKGACKTLVFIIDLTIF